MKVKKSQRLRRASECFALWILEELGFTVLEVNKPLLLDGIEVSDVDVVAEKDGEIYAVEVKAGAADVSGVRQAYTNAKFLNARPVLLARGADEKARKVAEKLGVELILLPDTVYCGYEDLREAVFEAIYSIIDDILDLIMTCPSPEDMKILEAIAESPTVADLAKRLGLPVQEAGRILGELRKKKLIIYNNYKRTRTLAKLRLLYCTFKNR